MNKVILTGNLANDPESRTTASGVAQCSFRLAVQRRFTNQQGVREADFLPVVCWRNTAEYIQNSVKKGDKIYIEGKLHYRTDNSCTPKRTFTSIIASEVIMLHRKVDNYTPKEEAE